MRLIHLGFRNLEPWSFPSGDRLRVLQAGLNERYPELKIVAFARRQDNDDVACWDMDHGDIVIVHDFASAGWEVRSRFANFRDWLVKVLDDLLDFD